MSRGMLTANETAIEQQTIHPVVFAELDFSSGMVRVHSSLGTITWGGFNWLGVGKFGNVTGLDEKSILERKPVTFTLSGVPNDLISIVLADDYQGRSAKVYVGFLDGTTYQLVANPDEYSASRMDVTNIQEGVECSITVTAESRMAEYARAKTRRYTNAEQQAQFAGDKGLEFGAQASQNEIVWGRKT